MKPSQLQASQLRVRCLSETTVSGGDTSLGEVDVEIAHEESGLPFIGGKTIHGLLRDSWLSMAGSFKAKALETASRELLGREASLQEGAILRVTDARVSIEVRDWVEFAVFREKNPLHPGQILRSMTDIRSQTAIDRTRDVAREGSLRSSRVLIRKTELFAQLHWDCNPSHEHLRVLALCCLATRHMGLVRNRGRGHAEITIDGNLGTTRRLAFP